MTNEELIATIHIAYDAMFAEYMYCPWCSGHIGIDHENHDDDCVWLKIPSLEYLERVHPRPQIARRSNVDAPASHIAD